MKSYSVALAGLVAVAAPLFSSAAGVTLTNGGFGQIAANPQSFGVAVCNTGAVALAQAVPVWVSTQAQTANVFSAPAIGPGKCEYTYLNYSQIGMQAGKAYNVTVTIDPQHSVISNGNNQASYSVTVPSGLAANALAGQGTANAAAQSDNFLRTLFNWIASLFK